MLKKKCFWGKYSTKRSLLCFLTRYQTKTITYDNTKQQLSTLKSYINDNFKSFSAPSITVIE